MDTEDPPLLDFRLYQESLQVKEMQQNHKENQDEYSILYMQQDSRPKTEKTDASAFVTSSEQAQHEASIFSLQRP